MRVFIAVTHLLGAGHLTRAAAIGRALAGAGHDVTLVSGGTSAPLVDTGGLDVVQLPPVRTRVEDFSTLLDADGRPAGAGHMARRREALLAAVAARRPDVVVTELFPFGRRGLADEFAALLAAGEARQPRPLTLCSVRDILVAPGKPAKVEATHALVRDRYDAVLVHGDEALIPLDASWPIDEALRRKLLYTGYVGRDLDAATSPAEVEDGGADVLVSGGSSAASLPLYRCAIEAARREPWRRWRVLVGHGVAEVDYARLVSDAPAGMRIERARPDFRALMQKASIFVGQAGYNTVMDIVATQARSVLVPFERGRETEQRLRAEALAARGAALVLPEAELGPEALLQAVGSASERPRPAFRGIGLDGARRAVEAIERLAAVTCTDHLRVSGAAA